MVATRGRIHHDISRVNQYKLPEAATLTQELQHFQMKIALDTGHDSYGAWREGTHDDLVLALACALWCGERKWPRFAPVGD
jgi:hypothetical protein